MAKGKMHTADQIKTFLDEVKTQSDRGTAVLASSVLDELLELLILARFIEIGSERREMLFEKMGAPLSSFSAKIELIFALGVISNEARLALHLIRDIRNKFAHRIEPLQFDHPSVAELIKTRATPGIQAMDKSNREKFLAMFHAMAAILYGTLAADIRIKSLKETHLDHFMELLVRGGLDPAIARAVLATSPAPKTAQAKRK